MTLVKARGREGKELLMGAGRETESKGTGKPELVIYVVEIVKELT